MVYAFGGGGSGAVIGDVGASLVDDAITLRRGGPESSALGAAKTMLIAQEVMAPQQSGWVGVSHGCSVAGATLDAALCCAAGIA